MEENRYPTFEEEENSLSACEPMEAVAISKRNSGAVKICDELDDLDWSSYPLIGPKNAEEAIARARQAWEDRNDPSKWVTSEQMWNRLSEKYPWLR